MDGATDNHHQEDDARTVKAALDALALRLSPGAAITDLKRLTGGASLQTWAFDLTGPEAPRRLILRRRKQFDDSIFTTSIPLAAEAALQRAAAAVGVPVAPVIHDCAPPDGLDEAYIVGYVPGETLGRRIAADARFEPARTVLARQAGEALARIHAIPLEGLPPLERMDALGALASYEKIYRGIGAKRPVLEAAFRLLERDAPKGVTARLVHGDFRNGNLIVDPQTGLAAVLDWELTHLGDPAEDLGWLCVNSWRYGVTEREAGGFASIVDVLAAYGAAGGEAISLERVLYWQMLGSLRWAVICLMMYQSYASGEERTVERVAIGRRLTECEVDLLALMEAA